MNRDVPVNLLFLLVEKTIPDEEGLRKEDKWENCDPIGNHGIEGVYYLARMEGTERYTSMLRIRKEVIHKTVENVFWLKTCYVRRMDWDGRIISSSGKWWGGAMLVGVHWRKFFPLRIEFWIPVRAQGFLCERERN